MSRFKLAIKLLSATTVCLSDAFTFTLQSPNRPSLTRGFIPSPVASYLDSLSDQPKKELDTLLDEIPPTDTSKKSVGDVDLTQELAESEKEPSVASLPKEQDSSASDATATAAAVQGSDTTSISEANDNDDQRGETKEESPDEIISLTIAAAAKSTLGANTSRNYRTTGQTLRDSKMKNEKRLSRSTYEKEKTSEKIASIKARMEEQIRNAEKELEEKLTDIQNNVDEEVSPRIY